ncbi:unnamed protein product [Parnassius apollo]|uniref:(apollo) hypothetical protein n=1 Tax=Parnassius apollo TaxID=110799 RepID=A0A8S3Y687_PARAO|nr:unnamed protein product [Parnassius apollo]
MADSISLSRNTVMRRVEEILTDIISQITEFVTKCKYFSLELDENCDLTERPLDSELVFELLGDGSQSDLDISDEEAEPRIEVRRLLDEDIPDQELPNAENESDPEIDVPTAKIARNNCENIPPTRSSNTARNICEKQRPRLWRRTEFNDKTHEYSTSLPA